MAGVDTFAPAVGSLHGRHPVPKRLDLELLRRVRDAIDVDISLRGRSDTPGHDFEAAARIGVSAADFNSELLPLSQALERQSREHPDAPSQKTPFVARVTCSRGWPQRNTDWSRRGAADDRSSRSG